jgi:hypothetical protein
MTNKEFSPILEKFKSAMDSMEKTKGADYTIGSNDRLNNFKQVGQLVCCPNCKQPIGARAVWGVYILKHILALMAWVKTGKTESEGLFGRTLDTALYSVLGQAIGEEEEQFEKEKLMQKLDDDV